MAMSGKYDFGVVTYDKTYTITLNVGYDTGFNNNNGRYTAISGSMEIHKGEMILEKIVIKQIN